MNNRLSHVLLAWLCLLWVASASANWWSKVFPHDVDVITVTYVTDPGKAYPPATPSQPVYYKIIDLGQQDFGRDWKGETTPHSRTVRAWLMKAMIEQGYRLADASHPPTQLLVFGWGMLQGGENRPALKFLGGDKVNLMWDWDFHDTHSFLDPKVLLRNSLHNGVAGKIYDFAEGNLFLGVVRSFTIDSEKAPQVTLLWETRFACPATGLDLNAALPLLIRAAAPNLGRETKEPVNLNASDAFGGHIDLGEMKILETYPAKPPDDAVKPLEKR